MMGENEIEKVSQEKERCILWVPGRHEKSSNRFLTFNIIHLQSLSESTQYHKRFAIEIEEKLADTK